MIYLISYEIKEQQYDYSSLKEAIMSYGDFQHPMATLWFVRVNDSTDQNKIAEKLRAHFHSDSDRIYVMPVPEDIPRQGWLPKAFWIWMKQ